MRAINGAALVLLVFVVGRASDGAARSGVSGAVAADHPLASAAGAAMLHAGGNAVDAAIAASLASGVVQPSGSGLGGGGFLVVVSPDGEAKAFDFRETAPSASTAEMYLQGASSSEGGLAVATPAEALGLVYVHQRLGRLPLRRVVAPAVRFAEEGFSPGAHLLNSLERVPMPGLFDEGYRRPRLALALTALADTQGEAFRTGWVAQDMVAGVVAAGGILSAADLQNYEVKEREVLRGRWLGREVITMPPPSSGGVALLELLGATEPRSQGGVLATVSEHCTVEAAKHAMARRAATGGDPDFVTADNRVDSLRIEAIRADCGATTFPSSHYASAVAPPEDGGTLHISVMDELGWAVALTTSINTSFGSRVVAPASGIVLNNEMDDFTTKPGVANGFGLIQGENNVIVPGKRPLSSMTPTVVLGPDGRAELVAGASGGPFIITATFQAIRATLEAGLTPQEAVAAPRWHHQWLPDRVSVEARYPAASLQAAGHETKVIKPFSAAQVVLRTPAGFAAASDPRKGGGPVVVGE